MVESYLARFPCLNQPEIVLRLLRQEYRVRQQHGDQPTVAEYRPYCPYTARPGPRGSWRGPDLARARQLVAGSGTRGAKVTVSEPGGNLVSLRKFKVLPAG